MHGIEIKNVKYSSTLGHDDSHTFSATVYKNGKRWCTASDDGWGGGIDFKPINKPSNDSAFWGEFRAFNQMLGPIKTESGELPASANLDIIVNNLVNKWLDERQMKRAAKTKTLFIQTPDSLDVYEIKVPYSESYALELRKKYPDAVILNELPMEIVHAIFAGEHVKNPDVLNSVLA